MSKFEKFMERVGYFMGFTFGKIGYTRWIVIIAWFLAALGAFWLVYSALNHGAGAGY